MKGEVVNVAQNYGFIKSEDGKLVFVHQKDVINGTPLALGQKVVFDVISTYRGDQAKSIVINGASLNVYQRNLLLITGMLLFSVLASLYFFNINLAIAYLISINATGFILMLYDKGIAGRGKRRVPEKILHLVSLMGAWPATTSAMLLFRHKVRKAAFFVPHAIIVVFEVLAIFWWYS